MNRSLRYFILGAVCALAAVAVCAVLPITSLSAATDKAGAGLSLFSEVFDEVRTNYVEPVTDQKLVEGAIKGMLASLDPHSSYMDAKEYSEMQVQTRGEFGGLGMQVTMENGLVKVVSPIDDTPGGQGRHQARRSDRRHRRRAGHRHDAVTRRSTSCAARSEPRSS